MRKMGKKEHKIAPFSVIVSFVVLSIIGGALLMQLPLRISPSKSLPGLSVSFSMDGNSARIIEATATSKLEAMLSRISGIEKISSTSSKDRAVIDIEFDKHVDLEMARFEASTIVREVWSQLPQATTYPQIKLKYPDEQSSRPFLTYAISGDSDIALLESYADNHIKSRLASIDGVSQITISGATDMQWSIVYDRDVLELLGVSIDNIKDIIKNYYSKRHLGQVKYGENYKTRLTITSQNVDERLDISDLAVKGKTEKLIPLNQIVQVVYDAGNPNMFFRVNGLNSIYISIEAHEDANQLKTANKIKDEIAEIETNLPNSYQLHCRYDATDYIKSELNKIYIRSVLTILILLLFVSLVYRDLRYLLLISISLAANLLVAFILYYFFKVELQLYSLAGVTISLSLAIDNIIVMTDHIRYSRNKKAFMAILAATLTTIGALVIIFLLDDSIKLNLQDFATVVIINLAVSLLTVLFLVPALIEKIGFSRYSPGIEFSSTKRLLRRIPIYFSRFYQSQILFTMKYRKYSILLIVLIFGLPIFMLPENIEVSEKEDGAVDSVFIENYNKIAASPFVNGKLRPALEKWLGGALRLFAQEVYAGSYFTMADEQTLIVAASLPNGATIEQMNHLIEKMEIFLSNNSGGIANFVTTISSAQNGHIQIFFTKDANSSGLPYLLKDAIIAHAEQIGGGSWGVFGLDDIGFSNRVNESVGNFSIELFGYNYDRLLEISNQLRDSLLENRRIKDVAINSRKMRFKVKYDEFNFDIDNYRLAMQNISPNQLFNALDNSSTIDNIYHNNQLEQIFLISKQSQKQDIWNLENAPIQRYKVKDIAMVRKLDTPLDIVKIDQQYRQIIQYEYSGVNSQGVKVLDDIVKRFNSKLPIGYSVTSGDRDEGWSDEDSGDLYWLLIIIMVIIYFITSILFNSLWQPLAIIFVIPIAYIGVFLSFYWLDANFDQGGFASLVLLCGITVNSSIYLIDEYNKISQLYINRTSIWCYIRAWNRKVVPILLTIVSTILGFTPFLMSENKEAFWYPMTIGVAGGLIASFIGIYIYLPLLICRKSV